MLLSFLHQLLYIAIVPPWQGPDEPRHFEVILQRAEATRSGSPADAALQQRIIDSMIARNFWHYGYSIVPLSPAHPPRTFDEIWPGFAHETHQPPLYYVLAGHIARIPKTQDVERQLIWVRLFSAILGTFTVGLGWASARCLFPNRLGEPALIALFIAALPMHAFIQATANNDNLVSPLVGLTIYLSTRILRAGLRPWELICAAGAASLAIATKRTGVIAAIALALAAGIELAGRRGSPWVKRSLIIAGALVLGIGLWIIAAPQWVKHIWYDFLHLPPDMGDLLFGGHYAEAVVRTPYLYYTRMLFESFWGRFGWLNIRLPDEWYVLIGSMCVVSGAGLVRIFLRALRGHSLLEHHQLRILTFYSAISILAILIVYLKEVLFLSYRFGVVPQGRYLFPVLIPIASLFIVGLREWVPATSRRIGGSIAAVAILAFAGLCIAGYVWPFYLAES